MEEKFSKEELEKDVSILKGQLSGYISIEKTENIFKKRRKIKTEIQEEKKNYKSIHRLYKKNNKIKNLVILGSASIFIVPIVIVPSIAGTMVAGYSKAEFEINKSHYGYVEECVYYDNFGNESTWEEDKFDEDYLMIETPYLKNEDGLYEKKCYKYAMNYSFREDIEEAVQRDYLDLLQEFPTPTYVDTVVKDFVEEENQAKVSVMAKIYQDVEEDQKKYIKDFEVCPPKERGFKTALFTALPSVILSLGLILKHASKLETLEEEYTKKSSEYRLFRKNSKNKIKKLKREYKG